MRARKTITFRHDAWRAPSIKTTDYCEHGKSETWSGHDLSSGTARCVSAPHYDALVAEAKRVGWPTNYRRDLFVHDRNALARIPANVPLVWMLRESGTHLWPATETAIGRSGHQDEYAWNMPYSVERAFGDEVRFYTWDGERLHEHRTAETCAAAARDLAQAYSKGFSACRLAPVTRFDFGTCKDVAVRCDA